NDNDKGAIMGTLSTTSNHLHRSTSTVTKGLKAKVALLALVAATAMGALAAPAYGAAGPSNGSANCHGVWLSYLSTSDMSPGQLQKDFGVSVQDVQATADVVCGL